MAVTSPANKPPSFEAIKSRIKHQLDNLQGESWTVDYETDEKSMRVNIQPNQTRLLDISETFALAAALHEANMKLTTHKGVRVVAQIDKSKPVPYQRTKGGLKREMKNRTKNGLDVLVSLIVIRGKKNDDGKVAGKGAWNEVWKEWNRDLEESFEDVDFEKFGPGGYWYIRK